MDSHLLSKVTLTVQRHYVRVMAFAVLAVLVASLAVYFFLPKEVVEAPVVNTEQQNQPKNGFARVAPMRIQIPKIELDTTFVPPLGLNPDKTVTVPDNYTEVGWYKGGATPGEIGPSVILGHVDSYQGPAVFYHLGKLEKGDEISIEREDGSIAVFVVEELERYDQDEFPTELVYGQIEYAGLRLVTCSGTFNKAEQKYSHNLVVYARLKE